MKWNRESLLQFLAAKNIGFQEARHEAVFTMTESALLGIELRGTRCKNLLVQDKKGIAKFLLLTPPEAAIDLAALGRMLGVGRLSLWPAGEMEGELGVAPGAMSPFNGHRCCR
jgi:Ala-tRNA(Pro) deacylase